MAVVELDLTGLKCPLPVLRTRKALARLRDEDSLEVFATDPLAAIDIPVLVQSLGFSVRQRPQDNGRIVFVIAKKQSATR